MPIGAEGANLQHGQEILLSGTANVFPGSAASLVPNLPLAVLPGEWKSTKSYGRVLPLQGSDNGGLQWRRMPRQW